MMCNRENKIIQVKQEFIIQTTTYTALTTNKINLTLTLQRAFKSRNLLFTKNSDVMSL